MTLSADAAASVKELGDVRVAKLDPADVLSRALSLVMASFLRLAVG